MHLQSIHSFTHTKPLRECAFRTNSLSAGCSPQRFRVSYYQITRPSRRIDSHRRSYGSQRATRMTSIRIRYRWLGMTSNTRQQSTSLRHSVATVQKHMCFITENEGTLAPKWVCKERARISNGLSFLQKHVPPPSQIGPHIRLVGCESQTKRAYSPFTRRRVISEFGLVKQKGFLLSCLR